MSKIQRDGFIQQHRDQKLDLDKLRDDSRAQETLSEADLTVDDLARADRGRYGNRDGKLDAREAFYLADDFDNDGTRRSLIDYNATGQQTPAGRAAGALGVLLDSKGSGPTGDDIARAALDRIDRFGDNYGVPGAWISPNPRIPGNRVPDSTVMNGTKDKWKCNLFGLDAVYQAGFETPHYESGWYPIATEVPNYSSGRNRIFDRVAHVDLRGVSDNDEKLRLIEGLMRQAKPGDLIMANHEGEDIADGGHTRVVTANNMDEDGTLDCAQARQDAAKVLHEDPKSVGRVYGSSSEEQLFLLRPIRKRADAR